MSTSSSSSSEPEVDHLPLAASPRFLLDLFAGAGSPVSVAAARLHLDRFEPVDLLSGPAVNLLQDDDFQLIRRLCASGLVGVAVAAPPCSSFSRLRLRPGGPAPVRTPEHPLGLPNLRPDQQQELQQSRLLHARARELLSLVAAQGGAVVLENPTSSLTWLDPAMTAWLRSTAPFLVDVAACAHGLDAAKSWLFATNVAALRSLASACQHPPKHHPPIAGRRLPDGTFASRLTARYPDSLAAGLISCLRVVLTSSFGLALVRDWSSLLPCSIQWPVPDGRVEDGAGANSTACWSRPHGSDIFGSLRKQWTHRLIRSNLHIKISSALLSGSRSAPLTEDELAPFLADLRAYLAITDERLWEACLSVPPRTAFPPGPLAPFVRIILRSRHRLSGSPSSWSSSRN